MPFMTDPDDLQLIERTLGGDIDCFEELLEKYEKPVFNAALRLLGNSEDAGEVTQIVFIKAYRNLNRFNPNHKLFSWLYRIAINESINMLSKSSRTQELSHDVAAPQLSPEECVCQTELELEVQKALMLLQMDHRLVLILRHFLDCSYRDMSGILDIPEKTVKSRLFTARQKLKDRLVRQGVAHAS